MFERMFEDYFKENVFKGMMDKFMKNCMNGDVMGNNPSGQQ